jgi:polysaccharide export outer membrane protein
MAVVQYAPVGSQAARRSAKWTAALIAVICLGGFFPSCASTTGAVEVDQFKDPNASAPREYVIRVGDLLSVQVYSDEKASGRPRVRNDGRITLPFLNDIDAAGKTPVKLTAEIEEGLKGVIVNPKVTVSVEESSPLSISVLGEVSKPGLQSLQYDAGVADALAAAGGLTPFADKDRIFVVRTRPEPVRIHFTYDALTRSVGRAALFRLRAGDVVIVE